VGADDDRLDRTGGGERLAAEPEPIERNPVSIGRMGLRREVEDDQRDFPARLGTVPFPQYE
jgi:hypothetical protein